MNLRSPDTDSYRHERKFLVSEFSQYEIEAQIKLHPAMFSEIYQPRFVNNLYFDSPGRRHYFDNIDGIADRVKVRIRWYGDLFGTVAKPVLELKLKHGLAGRKNSCPLVPFSIDRDFKVNTVLEVFKKSDISEYLRSNLISLEFSLLNRYQRKYFQSADRKYRITIDSEMTFYQIQAHNNTFLYKTVDLMNTVVELKYALSEDQHVEEISNHFPFRISRNSKYINGIERLYGFL